MEIHPYEQRYQPKNGNGILVKVKYRKVFVIIFLIAFIKIPNSCPFFKSYEMEFHAMSKIERAKANQIFASVEISIDFNMLILDKVTTPPPPPHTHVK